jgi:hypothetical protein
MSGATQEAAYQYFASGKSKQLALGGTAPIQTIDYRYNERDWLATINSSLFWQHLGYNTTESWSGFSFTAQYNGNISWMTYWMVGVTTNYGGRLPDQFGWIYTYDNTSRLKCSDFGYSVSGSWYNENTYDENNYVYDGNGNLQTLNRNLGDGSAANLSYTYQTNTNRLTSVTGGTYQYDANGNVNYDSYRGVALRLLFTISITSLFLYIEPTDNHRFTHMTLTARGSGRLQVPIIRITLTMHRDRRNWCKQD